jgi:hypothetical protein
MEVFGRVQNGVVVLEEPAALPNGARVRVTRATRIRTAAVQRPVALPIFDYDGPPDIDLSNARVAEILDRDDASA